MLNSFLWQFSLFDKNNDKLIKDNGKDHEIELGLISSCNLPELIGPLSKSLKSKQKTIDRESKFFFFFFCLFVFFYFI